MEFVDDCYHCTAFLIAITTRNWDAIEIGLSVGHDWVAIRDDFGIIFLLWHGRFDLFWPQKADLSVARTEDVKDRNDCTDGIFLHRLHLGHLLFDFVPHLRLVVGNI